jgi:predicted NBD/HSP70 family sugar kinase
MNEISTFTNLPPVLPPDLEQASSARTPQRQPARSANASDDRVELSDAAASYDAQAATVLDQRMRDIRAQIANDTYLTPDKLEFAIDGLLRDILGEQT